MSSQNNNQIHGIDIIRAYELSWLNLQGKPQLGLLEISMNPADVINTITLKEILDKLNNQSYQDISDVKNVITKNLTEHYPSFASSDSSILSIISQQKFANDCFFENQNIAGFDYRISQGLRFICEQTDQPFIGTLHLLFSKQAIIDQNISTDVLRDQLLKFRNDKLSPQQFVSKIFSAIQNKIKNKFVMSVNLNRRGGISYQAIRTNESCDFNKFAYRAILE